VRLKNALVFDLTDEERRKIMALLSPAAWAADEPLDHLKATAESSSCISASTPSIYAHAGSVQETDFRGLDFFND